ncbi:ABC transporter ATP-binding protein [Streptomyces sp. NPDC057654]|uniref:ABC transporter ATP-binding protein n=1 Tax=Streptomyces sp. NPDC057654 TaxID=3346196 RepID=UPI0036A61688
MTDDRTSAEQRPLVEAGALKTLIKPVRGRLAAGVALTALSAVCAVVPYIAVAEAGRVLLDHGTGRPGEVWGWIIAAVAGAVLRSVLYMGATQLCHYADAEFRYLTRSRLARHLGSLPLGWFTTSGSGEVKKAVSDDVRQVHTLVAHAAAELTSAVVMPLTAVVYLLVADWRLALVVVGYAVLVLVVLTPRLQSAYEQNMDAFNVAQSDLTKASVELVDGIEVIKTYGATAHTFARFSEAADRLTRVCLRWMSAIGRPTNLINTLLSPASMLVWIAGAGILFVAAGWTDPATLLPFLAVGIGLPSTVMQMAQLGYAFRDAQLGATHIAAVLAEPALPEPAEGTVPDSPRVTFEDVRFTYGEAGAPALDGVSAVLEPGTVTALVGPSGSGKTTFARLIPRFWDVTSGRVTLGGADIRQIPTQELLGQVAFVFQEVVLLRATVLENIRLGRPDATDEEVAAAARAAQIHDVVMALPRGYDTLLEDGESELSGGERQRITIARAILQDSPVVILDEATAHADPHSEARIQEALSALGKGRTLLVIAHRLHTVAGADAILVLDGGRIVERGTHTALLEHEGLYARLWNSQQVHQEVGQ